MTRATYELVQDEIGPTNGEFRMLANREGWSEAFLVERCKQYDDCPDQITAIVKRVLSDGPASTIIPWWPLIDMFLKATANYTAWLEHGNHVDAIAVLRDRPNPYRALPNPGAVGRLTGDRKTCACGCGLPVSPSGRARFSTDACRRRAMRQKRKVG